MGQLKRSSYRFDVRLEASRRARARGAAADRRRHPPAATTSVRTSSSSCAAVGAGRPRRLRQRTRRPGDRHVAASRCGPVSATPATVQSPTRSASERSSRRPVAGRPSCLRSRPTWRGSSEAAQSHRRRCRIALDRAGDRVAESRSPAGGAARHELDQARRLARAGEQPCRAWRQSSASSATGLPLGRSGAGDRAYRPSQPPERGATGRQSAERAGRLRPEAPAGTRLVAHEERPTAGWSAPSAELAPADQHRHDVRRRQRDLERGANLENRGDDVTDIGDPRAPSDIDQTAGLRAGAGATARGGARVFRSRCRARPDHRGARPRRRRRRRARGPALPGGRDRRGARPAHPGCPRPRERHPAPAGVCRSWRGWRARPRYGVTPWQTGSSTSEWSDSGLMGSGITEVCARAGLDVVVVEADATAAERGQQRLQKSLQTAARRGKATEEEVGGRLCEGAVRHEPRRAGRPGARDRGDHRGRGRQGRGLQDPRPGRRVRARHLGVEHVIHPDHEARHGHEQARASARPSLLQPRAGAAPRGARHVAHDERRGRRPRRPRSSPDRSRSE